MIIEALRYEVEVCDSDLDRIHGFFHKIHEIYIPEFKIAFNEKGFVFVCNEPRNKNITKIEIDRSDALLLFYVVSNKKHVDKIVNDFFPNHKEEYI